MVHIHVRMYNGSFHREVSGADGCLPILGIKMNLEYKQLIT